MATGLYDWSALPYYGTMMDTGGQNSWDIDWSNPNIKTYAQVGLPGVSNPYDYSFQSTFGGHSGLTQNPDGTFTAQRRVEGSSDPTAYEQNQYRISDDGKSLIPVGNQWNPITIKDTGFFESIGDAASDLGKGFMEALPTLAVPVAASYLFPQLGLTGGSTAGSAAGGAAYLSPAEMDTLLASQTAAGGGVMGTGTAASGVLGNYMSPGEMDQILAGQTAAGGGAAAGLPSIGGASSGSGLLGSAGSGVMDFITKNPSLFGTLLGGALGGSAGGYNVGNRTPLKPLEQPKFTPRKEDYGTGLPGGLGNQSAGLFAEYMRRMGG